MRRIRVAVPVPALEALTYGLPDDFPEPVIGARVLVPLGTRVMTGVVVSSGSDIENQDEDVGSRTAESGERTRQREIRETIDILDDQAFLPADVVSLAAWVSEYYACGVGEAIGAAMPPRAWVESERYAQITDLGHARLLIERGIRRGLLDQLTGEKPVRVDALLGDRRGAHAVLLALERDGLLTITRPLVGSADAFRTVRVAALTAQGHDAPELKLGNRQREALGLLAAAPDGIDTADLGERGIALPTLKRLASLGLVSFTRRRVERDPFGHAAGAPCGRREAIALTAEQGEALARLRGTRRFGSILSGRASRCYRQRENGALPAARR